MKTSSVDYRVIVFSSWFDRFKFWLLGGSREILYPNRTEYRTGSVLSLSLVKRIYNRWFWRPKKYRSRDYEGVNRTEGETRLP